MGMRPVGIALGGGLAGFLICSFLVYPPRCGWATEVQGGDLATWVGATASFLAVAAALWLSGKAERQAARKDRDTATTIATALCDELRGNRTQTQIALEVAGRPYKVRSSHAKAIAQALSHLHVNNFTIFSAQIGSLGVVAGHSVATIYGTLVRCRAMESTVVWQPEDQTAWYEEYISNRKAVLDDILEELNAAIETLWPLISSNLGRRAPKNAAEDKEYEDTLRQVRRKNAAAA